MVQLPTEFKTRLDDYRGPLDLLLYLIKKEEINILDIPIARITEQYLTYLQILRNVDPNICGEFLVTAAQLMEIKSKTLLPVEALEGEAEELDDPRLDLVLQLLEYKKYKERALLLERMMAEHSQRYQRPELELDLTEEAMRSLPTRLLEVNIWDLLTAFQKVQLALSLRQPHRVLLEDRPIEEYMKAICFQIESQASRRLRFQDLFSDCRDRYDAIGFFLALLELAKEGRVRFHQEELFGPIEVELQDPALENQPAALEPAPDE
ncbi:MAG: segregation/condensation protein A [Planctomycetes bacterium]|nr:segregation/condensation protein A [Planctomycetota bacterium]